MTFEQGSGGGKESGSAGPDSERGSGRYAGVCARGKGLCIWRVESWLLWLKHKGEMILERGTGANL